MKGRTMTVQYAITIMTRRDNRFELLKKCAGIISETFPNETFKICELLIHEGFTWNEKKLLKDLFDSNSRCIATYKFDFSSLDGIIWVFDDGKRQRHEFTMKILNMLHYEGIYKIGATVYTREHDFIKSLIGSWNAILKWFMEKEWREEDSGYEITEEMVTFISYALMEKTGIFGIFDYSFVRRFLEALSEYDETYVERLMEEEMFWK
jgi:hypothetical protein